MNDISDNYKQITYPLESLGTCRLPPETDGASERQWGSLCFLGGCFRPSPIWYLWNLLLNGQPKLRLYLSYHLYKLYQHCSLCWSSLFPALVFSFPMHVASPRLILLIQIARLLQLCLIKQCISTYFPLLIFCIYARSPLFFQLKAEPVCTFGFCTTLSNFIYLTYSTS